MKPKRIILIRHGESEGNMDKNIYGGKPDYALQLTENGIDEADKAGKKLMELIGDETAFFYISPMWRTRMTFEEIARHYIVKNRSIKGNPNFGRKNQGYESRNGAFQRYRRRW
ncbi:MAG: histidine phosphatase family protein [Saprospiraceae bacterium]|nr:histidine phosphatase family protein [Saprospiraceae bacterium]